jgi:hypothetical protein
MLHGVLESWSEEDFSAVAISTSAPQFLYPYSAVHLLCAIGN